MRSIKATLNFQMNYGVLKTTATPQISYGKYFNSNTKRCSLCLNEKLEIGRHKGRKLLNKWSKTINKCRHRNKFVLVLYDSKDWIKFSVPAFEQRCVKDHSFPKFDYFKSSWSRPGFGSQCLPVVVGLFSNHAYVITGFPSLVGSQLTWN